MKARLKDNGRLVIPVKYKKELGIEIGNELDIDLQDNKLIITNPKEVDYKERIDKAIEYIKLINNDYDTLYSQDIELLSNYLLKILEGDK